MHWNYFYWNQSLEEAIRNISHEGTNRHLAELTDPPQSTYRYKGIGLSESNIYKELDCAADCCQALFLKSTKCAVQRERWKEEADIPKKQSISDCGLRNSPHSPCLGTHLFPLPLLAQQVQTTFSFTSTVVPFPQSEDEYSPQAHPETPLQGMLDVRQVCLPSHSWKDSSAHLAAEPPCDFPQLLPHSVAST